MQYPKIQAILRNSKFSLGAFKSDEIQFVEDRIIQSKDKKGNTTYLAECLKRGGNFKVTPEEVVRQIFLHRLIAQYKYHKDHIRIEYPIR